jgi:hypothetical protein
MLNEDGGNDSEDASSKRQWLVVTTRGATDGVEGGLPILRGGKPNIPPTGRISTRIRGATFQKTAIFILVAVRTQNLANSCLFYLKF